MYSTAVAAVSGMEVVLFRHARRRALLQRPMPDDVYRWGVAVSLAPVGFFCLLIPLAFVNTTLAVASWFLAVPYQVIQNRRMPAHAEEHLEVSLAAARRVPRRRGRRRRERSSR